MNKGDNVNKVNIKVKGFDYVLVDEAAKKIYNAAKATGAKVSGPIPLPTKREEITILRSVHVNKPSREQFESRTHKRLLVLEDVSDLTQDKIKRLELPAGVALQIVVKSDKKVASKATKAVKKTTTTKKTKSEN